MMRHSSRTWRLRKCHNQIIFSAESIFHQAGRVDRDLNWDSTNPSALFVGNDTLQVSVIRDAPPQKKKIPSLLSVVYLNVLQEFAMQILEEESPI
jgi:DNA-binding LacI/PurR family transcriptional regulator